MSAEAASSPALHGLVAEFEDGEALLAAAHGAHAEGYRDMDAYSPIPIEELDEALGIRQTRLPWIVLGGGVTGCLLGYGLCLYTSAIAYPLNVGGRPLNSWVSFIPPTFETTILLSAITAVIAMLASNGLPRLHHPIFGARGFERASQDRFFLCIEATDPRFDRDATGQLLQGLGATAVTEVADE